MGDKRFHSETSLQHMGEEEEAADGDKDPGVINMSVGSTSNLDDHHRKRAMSQPGPVSGSMLTATAARAARRRPLRSVAYADPERNDDERFTRLTVPVLQNETVAAITPIGERGSPLPYNGNYRNGDIKSLSNYRMYATNSFNTPRKRSVATMDAQSIRSVETHAPPPTTPEQNKKLTSKHLTVILSVSYAITIVSLGAMIFLSDPFLDDYNVSPIYCLLLSGIGFLYLLILVIDIGRYKAKALKNQKVKSRYEQNLDDFLRRAEMDNFGSASGALTPVETLKSSNIPPPGLLLLKHDYCFSTGRHGGSFYLKLGATAFALGHLVHSLLLITVQIGLLLDEDIDNDECVVMAQVVLDFFYPLYCFFQLFFIFKYSNVIIIKWQGLARFAFMHFIGSSLCFWVWAIVRETMLAIALYAQMKFQNNQTTTTMPTTYTNESDFWEIYEEEVPSPQFFDPEILFNKNCIGNDAITSIYQNFSPYLFPFTVEFNILIVGIYFIVWSHIGSCSKDSDENDDVFTNSSVYENNTVCKIPTASEENDFTSNFVIHADCHASNRGLFAGMVVMVLLVGLLILGFVFSSVGDKFVEAGYLINNSTMLSLHFIMLFGVIFAFFQTTKLDVNEHPVSLLDDILLFICLPAFLMEAVFTMVATLNILNVIRFIDVTIMTIQIIIQTTLLVDGLRRCSNTRKLRRTKPGRELLMFLLITNVAMWLTYTFSYKSPESLDERYTFYGKVAWSILGHVCLPLIMFYRFHSSVCFADIWDAAYKPGSDH